MTTADTAGKRWRPRKVFDDDGVTWHCCATALTDRLFLKMAGGDRRRGRKPHDRQTFGTDRQWLAHRWQQLGRQPFSGISEAFPNDSNVEIRWTLAFGHNRSLTSRSSWTYKRRNLSQEQPESLSQQDISLP